MMSNWNASCDTREQGYRSHQLSLPPLPRMPVIHVQNSFASLNPA